MRRRTIYKAAVQITWRVYIICFKCTCLYRLYCSHVHWKNMNFLKHPDKMNKWKETTTTTKHLCCNSLKVILLLNQFYVWLANFTLNAIPTTYFTCCCIVTIKKLLISIKFSTVYKSKQRSRHLQNLVPQIWLVKTH